MRIAVVDGQGGGIGRAVVEKMKSGLPGIEILALGTNSAATGNMLKAGADEGATGENAIIYNAAEVDVIVGVIAIITANSMLGEMTPAMAAAIGSSKAFKVLLPINRCRIHVVSVGNEPLATHIDNAVKAVRQIIEDENRKACRLR